MTSDSSLSEDSSSEYNAASLSSKSASVLLSFELESPLGLTTFSRLSILLSVRETDLAIDTVGTELAVTILDFLRGLFTSETVFTAFEDWRLTISGLKLASLDVHQVVCRFTW